eukprot:GEMP01061074.1.p2 GENE.GEMP01061074.1~~GEMP01061074.1.p2  ORF type:complete len:139 (+),score=30.19 GEMP01061074.1:222-638(+)
MAICSFFLLTLAVAQNSTPRLKLPPPKKDTDTRPTLRTLKEKPSVFTGILHNIERVDCPFGRLISRARKECIDAMARLKVVRGKKPAPPKMPVWNILSRRLAKALGRRRKDDNIESGGSGKKMKEEASPGIAHRSIVT